MSVNDEIEYQIGASSITNKTTLKGGESINFDFENAAVFKRLADDIYESPEAGIREPLQNGLTAIKRAINNGYLETDEAVINIKFIEGDQDKLIIQDNGIGISREVIDEVLTVIGRSQSRDNGSLSGKYGMGFLACYKLVGTDGGFIMYTNSRENNNPPTNGIWKPGKVEIDKENQLENKLSEDDYGTRFEFFIKPSIESGDIMEWVEKHAKWAQIPIMYEEHHEDGSVFTEDYGTSRLRDKYSEEDFYVEIDNEYYTAISGIESEKITLLINSPIRRNSLIKKSDFDLPYDVDIRLKNENGIIIEGPNKGLMPVEDSEYQSMTQDRQKMYIPYSEMVTSDDLTEEKLLSGNYDICLPKPTGTRDSLKSNKEFWNYIFYKISNSLANKYHNVSDKLDNPEDLFKNVDLLNEFMSILNYFGLPNSKKDVEKFKSAIYNFFEFRISDEEAKIYIQLASYVDTYTGKLTKNISDNKTKTTLWKLIYKNSKYDYDGDTYFAVSVNETKLRAALEVNENNVVVKLPNSKLYDYLEMHIDWKRKSKIKKYIDRNDLSDETENLLYRSSNTKSNITRYRNLTIHYYRGTKNKKLKEIRNWLNENPEITLIVFKSNSERNLRDSKIDSKYIQFANVLVKEYKYISDLDNVYTANEWIDENKSNLYTTSNGEMTATELLKNKNTSIFHIMEEDYIKYFRKENIMSQFVGEKFREYRSKDNNPIMVRNEIKGDNIDLYCPLTRKQNDILCALNNMTSIEPQRNYYIYSRKRHFCQDIGTILTFHANDELSDAFWYMWASFPSLQNDKEISSYRSNALKMSDSFAKIIDATDAEYIKSNKLELRKGEKYLTSEGYMTVKELSKRKNVVVVHIVNSDVSHLLRKDKDVLNRMKKYVYENHSHKRSTISRFKDGIQDYYSVDEIGYVILSKYEFNLNSELFGDDNPYIIKDYKVGSSGYIDSNTMAYAHGLLNPEQISELFKTNNSDIPSLNSGGYKLINLLHHNI